MCIEISYTSDIYDKIYSKILACDLDKDTSVNVLKSKDKRKILEYIGDCCLFYTY